MSHIEDVHVLVLLFKRQKVKDAKKGTSQIEKNKSPHTKLVCGDLFPGKYYI